MANVQNNDEIKMSTSELICNWLFNAPNELYNKMPNINNRKIDGKVCLMGMIKEASESSKYKELFKKLRITLPETYDQV